MSRTSSSRDVTGRDGDDDDKTKEVVYFILVTSFLLTVFEFD